MDRAADQPEIVSEETSPLTRREVERPWRRLVLFLASLAAAIALTTWLLRGTALPREAAFMAGIFLLAALLWLTEALPLFATALLVIALQILLLANPGRWPGVGFEAAPSPALGAVLATAVDPILLLFFGGFLLARAAVKEGVDAIMAGLILRPFGSRPPLVLLGVILVTALFSMWMSNTAATAMMIALVGPMLLALPRREPFRKALVLAVPFAANVGGMGTPIGSPPNAVAIGFLRNVNLHVSFLEWMLIAVPLMLGLLVLVWALLLTFYPPTSKGLRLHAPVKRATARTWFVVAVFGLTVALWLSEPLHRLPASLVALLPAVAFTATALLDQRDVNSLDWNILILIAGGISLGAGMQMTGLDRTLADLLSRTAAGDAIGPVAVGLFVLATVLLSTFMSNTAAVNLLLPIAVTFAMSRDATGFRPVQVAIGMALAASVAMALPISTPPNAIAYARGEFATRDMAISGALIGLIAVALIVTFGGMILRLWSVA